MSAYMIMSASMQRARAQGSARAAKRDLKAQEAVKQACSDEVGALTGIASLCKKDTCIAQVQA